MNINDIVEIKQFDDGNQSFKYKPNVWKIIGFKFNKSKSIIKNTMDECIKPRSISTWKIKKMIDNHIVSPICPT